MTGESLAVMIIVSVLLVGILFLTGYALGESKEDRRKGKQERFDRKLRASYLTDGLRERGDRHENRLNIHSVTMNKATELIDELMEKTEYIHDVDRGLAQVSKRLNELEKLHRHGLALFDMEEDNGEEDTAGA